MSASSRGWFAPIATAADIPTFSQFVQVGRRREVFRTLALMVGLHLLQIPLYLVATGRLHSAAEVGQVVPGRLLLAIDLGCILTRMFVAYRAWGLVRSRRAKRGVLAWARYSVDLVMVFALVNFLSDVALWLLVDADGNSGLTGVVGVVRGLASTLSLLALCSVLVAAFWPRATDPLYDGSNGEAPMRGVKPAVEQVEVEEPASERVAVEERTAVASTAKEKGEDVVICCSGGGIRASAFSLGGLQVLQEANIYQKASAVIGVSGGGYTAAAHHVVRWNVRNPDVDGPDVDSSVRGDWQLEPDDLPAFAASSPELHWLRRHTRYVLDSAGTLTQAVLSLAWGIAVNILLIAIGIGAAGWLLGWLFLSSGRLTRGIVVPGGGSAPAFSEFGGPWGADWRWVPWLCLLPLIVGVVTFAVEKVIDRFGTVWVKPRRVMRRVSRYALIGGAALSALLLGLPWLVETVVEWAASSASLAASLVQQAGLVPNDICTTLLQDTGAACGARQKDALAAGAVSSAVTANSVSIAAVVSAVLAVLASLSGQSPAKSDEGKTLSRLFNTLWAKIKDPVIPYTAVTVIAVVALGTLIRTVSLVVTDGTTIEDWQTGLLLTLALILVRIFTEPNRTSMHHFFRERISEAFFVHRSSATKVGPIDYRQPLRFSDAGPDPGKGPRLVACAVANVTDSDLIPSNRGCTPFVFDDAQMGLTERMLPSRYARRSSATYEFAADQNYRDATIPAAVAMSAAAFSPLAGRENVRLAPYRVVLALGNARLGVWLPNPMWVDEVTLVPRLLALGRYDEAQKAWAALSTPDRDYLAKTSKAVGAIADRGVLKTPDEAPRRPSTFHAVREAFRGVLKKPGIFSLILEAFGSASVYDRFLYVTDGGHYDNLGLIEALRRRPDHIYVLDASNDPEDTFHALGQAMATAQMDLSCEITMDPRPLRRLGDDRSAVAWRSGSYLYADGSGGAIHLVKAILTKNSPWEIEAYASAHIDFPRTSTGRQLYSEFDFEAYRALGHYGTSCLLEELRFTT